MLRLNPGGDVSINMTTNSTNSETLLRESAALLNQQMAAAGLNLTQLQVEHGEIAE